MAEPGFWDDSEAAQKVISENNANKETYDQFHSLAEELEEIELMVEMLQEEHDAVMQEEAEARINALDEKMNTYELSMLLDGPYDRNNAIVELHPGAGGTLGAQYLSRQHPTADTSDTSPTAFSALIRSFTQKHLLTLWRHLSQWDESLRLVSLPYSILMPLKV